MNQTNTPSASNSTKQIAPFPGNASAITAVPIRRRFGKLILKAALVVGCSFGGFAASLAIVSGNGPAEAEAPIPSVERPEESVPQEADSLMDGHHIDEMIESGDFKGALHLCRSVSPKAYGSDERLLMYREALCLEALRQWREGQEAYKKMIQPNPDLPVNLWARGTLGQARCALGQGDAATSRELLDRVLLHGGDPSCNGQHILGECLFLLGRVEVQDLGVQRPLDPFDCTAISWPSLEGGLDRYLIWMKANHTQGGSHGHHEAVKAEAKHQSAHDKTAKAEPETQHEAAHETVNQEHKQDQKPDGSQGGQHEPKPAVHSPGSHWLMRFARRAYVYLRQSERPVAEQIRAVGTAVGMKVHIEPGTEEKISTVVESLDLDGVPLPSVLTALTRRHGLGWRMRDGIISIESASRKEAAQPCEAALLALRRGLEAAPDHPRILAARVTAANLDFEAGRSRKAAWDYRRFLETESEASESLHATYNLGLIELSTGNMSLAQSRLLNAIDRAPGTQWADLCWWWIARSHLDVGDTASARKPLQHAQEGKSKSVAAAADLGMIACALLEGEEDEAREILSSHRVHNGESHAAVAEFFDALLRYRSKPSESRGDKVADTLVGIGEGRLLGPAGYLLAGQVYREIGRFDHSAGVYDAARELTRGPVAVRMTFEAAERYDQLDLREEARKRYSVVAAVAQDEWGSKAELRLADLAARDRRGEECIRRCRALLGRKGIESKEVLALMGRGYELLKMYRSAAECFAGHVPE
jgi:tetratricopeptide (TPR) repeat protein